jgi:hypothetical protein
MSGQNNGSLVFAQARVVGVNGIMIVAVCRCVTNSNNTCTVLQEIEHFQLRVYPSTNRTGLVLKPSVYFHLNHFPMSF